MLAYIVPFFLIMVARVALIVSVGLNFLGAQKKKKVTAMLQTAVGAEALAETKVLLETVKVGSISIAKFLSRFNFGRKMEAHLQQAGLNLTLNTLLIQMLALSMVGALLGARFPVLMSLALTTLAGAVVFGLAPYGYVMQQRRKRLAAFEEQFPDALDFLARAMRAGHAFSISLEMCADESPQPLGTEFRKVFNEQNLGLPIETALANVATRVPLLDVRFFVSAVLLQRETGGNLSEILTKLAHIIRERFQLRGQVKAASAHGRITGAILTIMPIALMLGLLVVAPGYLQGMARDEDGKYLIGGAIIGIILGHLTIKRIVNIKV